MLIVVEFLFFLSLLQFLYDWVPPLRPRLQVSGFICIRKHFFAVMKLYAAARIRIRCVFDRLHVSAKTIRIRKNRTVSMRCRLGCARGSPGQGTSVIFRVLWVSPTTCCGPL